MDPLDCIFNSAPPTAKAEKVNLLAEVLETKTLPIIGNTSGYLLRKASFETATDKSSLADSVQWHIAVPSVPLLAVCRLPRVNLTQV